MELTIRAELVYSIMGDDHSLTVFILLSLPVTTTTRYHNSEMFSLSNLQNLLDTTLRNNPLYGNYYTFITAQIMTFWVHGQVIKA